MRDRAAGCSLNLDWLDLPGLFPNFPDSGRWLPLLQSHAALIEEAATHTRVTSVEPGQVVQRHYAESLELLRIALESAPEPETIVDVGSGGGYPGLVLAIIRPGSLVHLVEPLQKRARLLEELARELGLSNVRVHALRAEEAGRGPLRDSATLVTARAVAALRELLEYTAPLAATGGWLAFPKGSSHPEELAAAVAAMNELGCEHRETVPMRPEISSSVAVLTFEKSAPTPARYPRRPGMPA